MVIKFQKASKMKNPNNNKQQYRKAITYFYKDGSGFKMEARFTGSNVSYSKECDSKESALSHEFSVKSNPEKFL